MDTRDGRIYEESELIKKLQETHASQSVEDIFNKKIDSLQGEARFFRPMDVLPTERQMVRKPPRVGRNEPCPCGSGKKFKKCCLNSVG